MPTCGPGSHTYRIGMAITNASATAASCFTMSLRIWPGHARHTPTTCGSCIPPRLNAAAAAKRSDLAGWAEYGYCASHSRYFWGLRLHLITTPSRLPVAYALAGAKTDEHDTCLDMISFGGLDTAGVTLIADKGYRRASFETELNAAGITLIRPGVCVRVLQRILALTAAIWHNETASRAGPARSLTAYDH